MPNPANGTLFDMLTKYGITWKNYAFDLPATVIVPQTLENHPTNISTIPQFLLDAAAGTLPQVIRSSIPNSVWRTTSAERSSGICRVPDRVCPRTFRR